jgi:hypothetical protein
MRKTLTAMALAIAMLFVGFAPATATPVYNDDLGVHEDSIIAAYDACLLWGFEDGTFRPNGDVTESQVQRVAARFDARAYRGEGTMNPATRAYVANAMYVVLRSFTDPTVTYFSDVPPFVDAATFWHPSIEGINMMAETGIMDGYGDGTFGPDNRLTRGQFAKVVVNTHAELDTRDHYCSP